MRRRTLQRENVFPNLFAVPTVICNVSPLKRLPLYGGVVSSQIASSEICLLGTKFGSFQIIL